MELGYIHCQEQGLAGVARGETGGATHAEAGKQRLARLVGSRGGMGGTCGKANGVAQ